MTKILIIEDKSYLKLWIDNIFFKTLRNLYSIRGGKSYIHKYVSNNKTSAHAIARVVTQAVHSVEVERTYLQEMLNCTVLWD